MKYYLNIGSKNVVQLMLLVGIVQVALYYISGATVRSDGGFAVAQPDTLLYCQAARRIVEGYPMSFSDGVAVSTGTTSVFYPFVLAIPYALGCTGDSLFRAGFFLNAAFYMIFLWAWGLVIREKFARGIGLFVAAALVALSGQSAFCALAQSDTGFWMAVSSLVAAGIVLRRTAVFVPALLVAPWVRPEGAIICVVFAVFGVFRTVRCNCASVRWRLLSLSFAAFLSAMCVFAFNFMLTGHAGFSSVAHKSYFSILPFADAIVRSAIDAVQMSKGLLLGLPVSAPRDFFALPLLGAAFMWLGVIVHDWRRSRWRELMFLIAAAFGFLSVAASGWQGTNFDRYLVWLMPVSMLFTARGIVFVSKSFSPAAAAASSAILIAFAAASAMQHVASFHVFSERTDHIRAFAEQCERTMTKKSAVAVGGWAGVAFEFSPRRVAQLPGIYSPEFEYEGSPSAVVEILKREPDKRFSYMFSAPEGLSGFISSEMGVGENGISEMVLPGPLGFSLKKMKWLPFDVAVANPLPKNGGSLSARVDVGYEPDEKASDYDVLTTYDQRPLSPFAVVAPLNGTNIVEAGRILLGGDEMTVSLMPGKDVEVVLRTLAKATAFAPGALGAAAGGKCEFASPMELHVEVDGRVVGHVTFNIEAEGFTDAHFTISGSEITASPCRITFHGDHIACGYWFYQ